MPAREPLFTKTTFQFFRELGKHNRKTWMDSNRDRYRDLVVRPVRAVLEEL
jgi:uncharacterized protein (DUF2461 family)